MEDVKIDPKAAVQSHRRQAALSKELQATMAEMTARQWSLVVEADPSRIGAAEQERQARENAEIQRAEADAMHKLAGTKPEEVQDQVLINLKGNLAYFESRFLGAKDAEDHPEAYGSNSGQEPVVIAESGLKALKETIEKVEGVRQKKGKK